MPLNTTTKVLLKSEVVLGYTDQRTESKQSMTALCSQLRSNDHTVSQTVIKQWMAVHLKRNGLPLDLALTVLKAWAKKNHPADGKGIITDQEIEHQTKCAFGNSYRSIGCEDPAIAAYCDKNCPLYTHTVGKQSA